MVMLLRTKGSDSMQFDKWALYDVRTIVLEETRALNHIMRA